MIINLFSSFDPSTGINLSLSWISTFIGFIIIPPLFWLIPSRLNVIWINIISLLRNEFNILINNNNSQGSTLIFISLFSLVLFHIFLGLFPYIFTSTSQLVLILTLVRVNNRRFLLIYTISTAIISIALLCGIYLYFTSTL